MQQIYRRTPMPKCDFNKVALQLYWNRISACVFSCRQICCIFSEHLFLGTPQGGCFWTSDLLKCSSEIVEGKLTVLCSLCIYSTKWFLFSMIFLQMWIIGLFLRICPHFLKKSKEKISIFMQCFTGDSVAGTSRRIFLRGLDKAISYSYFRFFCSLTYFHIKIFVLVD